MKLIKKISTIVFKPEYELKLFSKIILSLIVVAVVLIHIIIAEYRLSQNEISNTFLKLGAILIVVPLLIYLGILFISKLEDKKSQN